MARRGDREYEVVSDDVEWLVDDEGTEYFVEDGVRFELADDGYAYPVIRETSVAASDAPAPAEAPTLTADDAEAPEPEADEVAATAEPAGADVEAGAEVEGADPEAPVEPSEKRTRRRRRRSTFAPPSADEDSVPTIEVSAPAPAAPAPLPDTAQSDLLRLTDVRSGYGRLPVLHGIDLRIGAGETVVLLGLNGAGKTTTALNVCGALGTWSGSIEFGGRDITAWGTRRCVAEGIVLVPEGRRVFPELTVDRNLQVGAWSQRGNGDWIAEQSRRVMEYFPRLEERRKQLAGTLSGGEQQMLAIARGLMANPRLLIIDEASMGLAPVIVKSVFEIVSHINDDGVTVMMIEQNVGALDVADAGVVIEQGRVVRELRGDELTDRSLISEILMG